MYFSAIQKIGEQALQSSTSQILGEGLPSRYILSAPLLPQASVDCPGSRLLCLPPTPRASPQAPEPALLPILRPQRGIFYSLALSGSPPETQPLQLRA